MTVVWNQKNILFHKDLFGWAKSLIRDKSLNKKYVYCKRYRFSTNNVLYKKIKEVLSDFQTWQ